MKYCIRHGEALLIPVEKLVGETRFVKQVIVAHSETGHHHILESDVEFEVAEPKNRST